MSKFASLRDVLGTEWQFEWDEVPFVMGQFGGGMTAEERRIVWAEYRRRFPSDSGGAANDNRH